MSEILQRTCQDAQAIADGLGLVCFFPRPDELFIDWDQEEDWLPLNRVLRCLSTNGIEALTTLQTISRNGKVHVYVKLSRELPIRERVALQAAAGSDPVKEALSTLRLFFNSDSVTRRFSDDSAAVALFETPDQAERVAEWRMG